MQNADGTAHFTYFDKETQLSFVWDGVSDLIQISHGGYGEPAIDAIPIQLPAATAVCLLDTFKVVCDQYVMAHKNSAVNTPGVHVSFFDGSQIDEGE